MQREVLELIERHAARRLRDAHDGFDADARIVDGDEVRNEALSAAGRNVDAIADLQTRCVVAPSSGRFGRPHRRGA